MEDEDQSLESESESEYDQVKRTIERLHAEDLGEQKRGVEVGRLHTKIGNLGEISKEKLNKLVQLTTTLGTNARGETLELLPTFVQVFGAQDIWFPSLLSSNWPENCTFLIVEALSDCPLSSSLLCAFRLQLLDLISLPSSPFHFSSSSLLRLSPSVMRIIRRLDSLLLPLSDWVDVW